MYVGTFGGKFFSFRKTPKFFRGFWNLSCESVGFWRTFFASVLKKALSFATETFLMKKEISLFKKMYLRLFWNLREFFVFLPTMLRQARKDFILLVQTNISTNNFFGKRTTFSSLQEFEQKFSEFWLEIFDWVVTTAIYMYVGTFGGKLFSFRRIHNFFRGFRNLSCKSVDS